MNVRAEKFVTPKKIRTLIDIILGIKIGCPN